MDQPGSPTGSPERGAVNPRAAADELFASSALVDVLVLLGRAPEERFYVNEIIQRTGRFPRSIQLALARLEAAGLVTSERQANAKFFRIAADHPFFPEVRSIVAKILDVRTALSQAFGELGGIRAAFLRPADAASDEVELVVVGEAARRAVEEAVGAVAARLKRPIQVQVFSPEEWARQSRRERSFVRWLLEERRDYLVGGDSDLPATAT